MSSDLLDLAKRARTKISTSRAGNMHAMWDVIFDAEAIAAGQQHLVDEPTTRRLLKEFLCE